MTEERDRTLELATLFSNLTFEELPSRVVHHATLSILNSIGCGLSAASLEYLTKTFSVLNIVSKQTLGGPFSAATILSRPERASIEEAAMLNGLAMTASFFDDTHLSTVVHPSGPPLAVTAHEYFFNNTDTPIRRKPRQDVINIVLDIEARGTPLTIKLCGIRRPEDKTQTIFSTYHGLAVGLVYGKAGIREFAMDVVNEPHIRALRDRIRLTADETLKDDQA